MNDKKRLQLRNKEISKLNDEITKLRKENDILKEQAKINDLEKSSAFEKTKQLIIDLQNTKNIYLKAIQTTKYTKQIYLKEIAKFKQLRKKIKKENNELLKAIDKK